MNEDVLLEEVLALAEQEGYEPAYDFLSRSWGMEGRRASADLLFSRIPLPAGAGRAPCGTG